MTTLHIVDMRRYFKTESELFKKFEPFISSTRSSFALFTKQLTIMRYTGIYNALYSMIYALYWYIIICYAGIHNALYWYI